jgi:transcriptional regulator with XRE-family HTH domain
MKTFRASIYDPQQLLLREWLVGQRKAAGLSQRQLADRLGVVRSLVGKVETGERRLDVIEFHVYCQALDANPAAFFVELRGGT